MTDDAFLKDVHIVIESLRNSYDLLVVHLGNWIITSLSFEDWDFQHQRELWTLLGLEPDRVDEFVALQLRFHGGRLKVAASYRDSPNLLESISTCLLHAWRFRKFTTSRWITVGDSCKTMVIALLTGVESLVRAVRRHPKTSDYYIHGFGRINEDIKKSRRHFFLCQRRFLVVNARGRSGTDEARFVGRGHHGRSIVRVQLAA